MLKIDDNLLQELDLGDLPLEEKDLLLSEIYQQLELRVGTRLADAMSEEQLEEFEKFMNGDLTYAENYLNEKKPDWKQSKEYQEQTANSPDPKSALTEFAALKWLQVNFPDYPKVVADELENLKKELKSQSTQIKQTINQQPATDQAPQPPTGQNPPQAA